MKSLSLILNAVLFVLVGVLFYLYFSGMPHPNAKSKSGMVKGGDSIEGTSAGCRIAFVNIDSLEANYEYFIQKKEELEKKQRSIEQELNSNGQSLQNEVAELRKKAPTMTQSEGEAAQRKIMQKQQALQQKGQNLQQQFMQQQQQFNDELQKRLSNFLGRYNADKRYTYILSYSAGLSSILYKDDAYDITQDVINGLNAEMKSDK